MTKEREISTFQINFLVYNISCVEIISFFSEIYNNPTLFILQYFFAIVKDFSLEIWYNISCDISTPIMIISHMSVEGSSPGALFFSFKLKKTETKSIT